ncbi:MAG TPA: hypothetical protein VIE43_09610 [Thermoanaerobaculia bacterium]|nr:hypothetical protein [Thermoanaerobaculia bacterium]
MDLDDLKNRLAEQDAKLERALRLNTTAVRELRLAKTRASLRWLGWGVVCELLMAIVGTLWLGDFLAGHAREPRFFLPAALLDLGVIALLGSCIRQLAAIAGLDYGLPVVAVQKELSRLRVLRLRTTKWTILLSFALWFPALIVMLEGFLGVDAWQILGAIGRRNGSFFAWAVANVLFGLAAAIAVAWISNRYADRVDRSPALRRFVDSLAGHSLMKAQSSLDSIVRFEAGI